MSCRDGELFSRLSFVYVSSLEWYWIFLVISSLNLCLLPSSVYNISCESGSIISIEALGVGARKSATKSLIITSTSCPTALTIGVFISNIASATIWVLKLHKSSLLPPPRPTITTSTLRVSAYRKALAISGGDCSPWTRVSTIVTSTNAHLFSIILSIS